MKLKKQTVVVKTELTKRSESRLNENQIKSDDTLSVGLFGNCYSSFQVGQTLTSLTCTCKCRCTSLGDYLIGLEALSWYPKMIN